MKIGLGTVQFGVDYGVSKKIGKTSPSEVSVILNTAKDLGIRVVDTAYLYGDSEETLGQFISPEARFDIITKTPQFNKSSLNADDARHLKDIFHASLLKLKCSSLYGLLIHRVEDLFVPGGDLLMHQLLELKQQGLVNNIGVSVYTAEQIDRVLDRFPIDLIQLPISVLDQRLLHNGYLQKLKSAGIQIHARSIFLQGLLLMALEDIPVYFDGARKRLESYHAYIKARELTPLRAALGFVSSLSEIDQIICGVNNAQQLHEIYNASQCAIEPEEFSDFSITDEAIVNPANWRL